MFYKEMFIYMRKLIKLELYIKFLLINFLKFKFVSMNILICYISLK